MALNYSHRHLFSGHLSDDNLVPPFGMMNGCLAEGVSDKSAESSTRCWHSNLEGDQEKKYGCFAAESNSDDIVDLLPSDPFGMDIQTTFTAITGWLEDLEASCDGYMWSKNEIIGGNEYHLFDPWDFFWNHGLSFQPSPNAVDFSERSNLAVPCSSSHLVVDEAPLVHHTFFPSALSLLEKEIPNFANITFKEKSVDSGLDICDTHFLDACGMLDIVGYEEGSDKSSAFLPLSPGSQAEETSFVEEAFTLALSCLGVKDLLAVERVCKSLFFSVRKDPWLWKTILIGQPLNEKITDDVLLKLVSRAQGKLQTLSLVECPKITDDGLRLVMEANPHLTKLSIPGCTRISIECLVDCIRWFNSQKNVGGIKHLRIGGLYGVDHEHFEELKTLLGLETSNYRSPSHKYFYQSGNLYLPYDDDRAIDVEMCPRCEKYRLVYDCPSEVCYLKDSSQVCRACTFCVARCAQCGRCVNNTEFEETFCLELLCSDCFKQLP